LNDGAAIDLWLLSYPYCKIVNTSYDPTLILLVFLNRYEGHLECIEWFVIVLLSWSVYYW